MIRTRFPITADRIYSRYKPMLMARARHFARLSGLPLNDLVSRGNEIFMKVYEAWNPKQASFSTLFWKSLTNGFINYVNKFDVPVEEEYTERATYRTPYTECAFKDDIESLSREAQVVVMIALNSRCTSRKTVQAILRCEGWKWQEIWKAWEEVKGVLK